MARPASRSMPAPPSRALPWVAIGRLAVGLILLAASTALGRRPDRPRLLDQDGLTAV